LARFELGTSVILGGNNTHNTLLRLPTILRLKTETKDRGEHQYNYFDEDPGDKPPWQGERYGEKLGRTRFQSFYNFMKNRQERIKSYLVLSISFLVVVYPIYLQYNNLSEIDLFSLNLTFEIIDQEDLLFHKESKAKIFTLSFSYEFSPLRLFFIGQFSSLSFPNVSVDQPISILRC
jgi:hypothetical protein